MSMRGKLAPLGITAVPGAATDFPNGIKVAGDSVLGGQGSAVADAAAATAVPVVVTFTANTPAPAATQTIADGTVPTVAELGQSVANQELVCTALTADIAELRTQLNAVLAELRTVGTIAT